MVIFWANLIGYYLGQIENLLEIIFLHASPLVFCIFFISKTNLSHKIRTLHKFSHVAFFVTLIDSNLGLPCSILKVHVRVSVT